ncbi:DUF1871 family protein [Bacillus marinisedimentorum]|uniref:DUF1871 family protein n=1 Tax=Bacillus marinisedimentorum TaxID=1821260 RepID=UPI001FE01D9D|nr:DUF1871 family protein [Bacillus marinisedimentorum]
MSSTGKVKAKVIAMSENDKILAVLADWDPLGYGKGSYEMEWADVLQAVHECPGAAQIAERIQGIFHFSYDEHIPMDRCRKTAEKLVEARETTSCDI